MLHDKWLTARLTYLRGLKAPSHQQLLLLGLADKLGRTATDGRILTALISVEATAERAEKAMDQAARIVETDKEVLHVLEAYKDVLHILEAVKEATFSARDRELYNSTELLIRAGLVDSRTGTPMLDRGELLGALLGLAKVPTEDPRRSEWKHVGDALLAEKAK